ncbi:hypothetical protein PNO25_07500 [Streptococcus oralis]|uniref:hypothetical protein n=1 Tax=Streptococcus oralis TaxID=1303 RepID=UPI0023311E97|nr:hypothetical protein [Streptococcus oralis]MDB6219365.1 hypothetical protein [Streptococcus oralis]
MNNINLLLGIQGSRRISNILLTKNGKKYFQFINRTNFLNDVVIKNIIDFLNTVRTTRLKLPIILNIGKVTVADKLSYIVLECLVYEMLNLGYSVTVKLITDSTIDTKGIEHSPLMVLNELSNIFSPNKQCREDTFKKEFKFISRRTVKYRRLVSPKSNSYLSKLTSDLILFLSNQFEFSDNFRRIQYDEIMVTKLANTIGELVGNATEHGEGDCLLDIDITHDFTHSQKQGKKFGAVNIAVLNFSNTNFGDKVKNKILNTDLSKSIRYQKIKVAYDTHQSYFNDCYNEEHFWNLASIQDKISGRLENYNNGGKGMTDLIKSIQNFTHEDYCYMMSGKEILNFKKELLKQDSDGFIGFNKDSFLQSVPETMTLGISKVFLPGVAYNLNFILEEVH